MTKRDQILRAWISREGTHADWISFVSYRGKVSERSTRTPIRHAAKEFCDLHVREILFPTPTSESGETQHEFPLDDPRRDTAKP